MCKKIKVFLGGYVNYLNAQNINCRALSEHLDKSKFMVSTMLFPIENATDFTPHKDVRYYRLLRPVRLWHYITYLRAIASADIAYLPKWENDRFCRFVANIFKTKVFTTVEGLIDNVNLDLAGHTSSKRKEFINHFRYYEPNLYAITKYISMDVSRRLNYNFCNNVLYLGVNSDFFAKPYRIHKPLNDIVFIGNSPSIKNVDDVFDAARRFPEIKFHMVGGNQLKDCTIQEYIERENIANITYHGRLDHTRLSELLGQIDLMFFPSRSEGFPKVHLETACAGVPTLCYSDYGASEWIDSGYNGIVVNTREEAFDAIKDLKLHPDKLTAMSMAAVELGKKFDWRNLVKTWEIEIERIFNH